MLRFGSGSGPDFFAQSRVLITDYSSMAFDAAYLRRPVLYFPFDEERFNRGAHVSLPGYFNAERDGFGPVSRTLGELLEQLRILADNDFALSTPYAERVEEAFDLNDGECSKRVVTAIEEMWTDYSFWLEA